MTTFRAVVSAAVLVLVSTVGSVARADIPPPDSCNSGQTTCSNAGPNNDQPGVCVASMCPHTEPGPDGGFVTMNYPCTLCMQTDAGSASSSGGSASGSGGATGSSSGQTTSSTTTSGTTTSSSGSSGSASVSGGCAVGAPEERGLAVAAIAVALGLLGLRRKRG